MPLHPTHGAYAKSREASEYPSHCLLSVLHGKRVALRCGRLGCRVWSVPEGRLDDEVSVFDVSELGVGSVWKP